MAYAIATCFTLAAGTATVAVMLPQWLSSPSNQTPQRADAILVLGSNGGERVPHAIKLCHLGAAANVILSVGTQCSQIVAEESKAAFAALTGLGLTEAMVTLQTASCNTWAEAHDAGKLLQSRGWQSVVVITDPPHMRRTDFSFSRAFEDTNFSDYLIPTKPDWWQHGQWWKNAVARQFVLSEIIKLAYYWARTIFIGSGVGVGVGVQEQKNIVKHVTVNQHRGP